MTIEKYFNSWYLNLDYWYRLCCPTDTKDIVEGNDRLIVNGNRSFHVPQAPLVFLVGVTVNNITSAPFPPFSRRERRYLGRAAARSQRLLQCHRKGKKIIEYFSNGNIILWYHLRPYGILRFTPPKLNLVCKKYELSHINQQQL